MLTNSLLQNPKACTSKGRSSPRAPAWVFLSGDRAYRRKHAFARVELLAILTGLAIVVAVVLPVLAGTNSRSDRVQCLNQLRRIGQGFQIWANDHADKFPWNVVPAEGGAKDLTVVECFQSVSNEIVSPRLLACPSDGARSKASSWANFRSWNVSYFAGLDADLSAGRTILSGDRNLTCSSGGGCGSIFPRVLSTTNAVWDLTIHNRAGNLLLSDGSTVASSNGDLTNFVWAALAESPTGTLRILPPQ